MRPREDRQYLGAVIEIGDLRIGTRDMALQEHAVAATLDKKRDLARDHLRGPAPTRAAAHEQPEIVALDMRDQHLAVCLGEDRRQINQ